MSPLYYEQTVKDLIKSGREVQKACQNAQLILKNKDQYQQDDYQREFDQARKKVEEKVDSYIKLNNAVANFTMGSSTNE